MRELKKILVVDPEASVRGFVAAVLRKSGCMVDEAVNGLQAEELLSASGPYQLLITDMSVDPRGGWILAAKARLLQPGIGVLYLAGYAGPEHKVWEEVRAGFACFLPKPFLAAQINATVASMLAF